MSTLPERKSRKMGNFIKSSLSVKASASLNVSKDLNTPDPTPEKAKAILKDNKKEKDENTKRDD